MIGLIWEGIKSIKGVWKEKKTFWGNFREMLGEKMWKLWWFILSIFIISTLPKAFYISNLLL